MREICFKCLRPEKACFCKSVVSFDTNTHFVILMHPKEAKRDQIGTGRLSNIALTNSQVIIGEEFDDCKKLHGILSDSKNECLLLYPGENSVNLDKQKINKTDKQRVILILDGTWPSARSMMRRSECLHNLPRVSFEVNQESRFEIKEQPAKYCLSTIESIHLLLEKLDEQEVESVGAKKQTLLETLDRMVRFHIECAKNPSLGHYKRDKGSYKAPSERVKSKKYKTMRRVCYENVDETSSPSKN